MSIFSENILKLLNDYKRLLKRYISISEREKSIINLGIKRKSLKFDNDVILYNKAHRVLQDIDYWTRKQNRTAIEYSGINEFYTHLKSYLSNYRVENNTVVHLSQKVSCALVQAIQIISLPEDRLSDANISLLDDCIQTISKFGSKEHCNILAKALAKQQIHDQSENLLTPALNNFIKIYCSSLKNSEEHVS